MIPTVDLEAVKRLSMDVAKSTRTANQQEARFLVDTYYTLQEYRIASTLRAGQLEKAGHPAEIVKYTRDQMQVLEGQIARALKWYAEGHPLGVYMTSITGIGPVISAGMLAVIDWEQTNVAGRVWSFAGLVPGIEWKKGEKRPWNPFLKTLLFKAGESFVKVQSNKNDFYGQWYAGRKFQEWQNNLAGRFAGQAAEKLARYSIGKATNAYQWYTGQVKPDWARGILEEGKSFPATLPKEALQDPNPEQAMLPPAHIHARARRWVVKLFASHVVEVSWWLHHGQLGPAPYAMTHKGHVDYIWPPCVDVVEELRPGFLRAMYDQYGPRIERNQKPRRVYMGESEDPTEPEIE